MAKNKEKKPVKTCADCVHEFACQMWNVGHIHEMSASACKNYETVKESPAYLIGLMDGRSEKKTNADRIRSMCDEELAAFFAKIGGDKAGGTAKFYLEWLSHPAGEN